MAEPAVDALQAEATGVEIIWRAFELRPEPVQPRDPQGEYLQRVWRDSVYPLAARLGMKMKLPPVQPRSRRAHEAAQWARSLGRFDDFNAAIFTAFFERGEDIGEAAVLLRLASALGLEAEALHLALERHEYQAGVLADEREAASLGVRGVPAFIAERRAALSGVQSADTLSSLIEHVRSLK